MSDPHFKTFDGTKYDYHGECDMVMTTSSSFASNLGFDLHIRTTIQDSYSFISGAALRIGTDVLEVDAQDGTTVHFNNRTVSGATLPELFSGFPLSKKVLPHASTYKVRLGEYEVVSISSFKNMLKVQVNAILPDASGLMGTSGKPGLVGRDGETTLSNMEMGAEWQVRPGDHPTLFHTSRSPQFPEPCILPASASTSRRLGENSALMRMATTSCSGVGDFGEMKDCIFDVIQTGDVEMALAYLGSE